MRKINTTKPHPALAIIIQAAREQAANTGKIDIDEMMKQIAGKYTIGGKEIMKHHANGTEKSNTGRG